MLKESKILKKGLVVLGIGIIFVLGLFLYESLKPIPKIEKVIPSRAKIGEIKGYLSNLKSINGSIHFVIPDVLGECKSTYPTFWEKIEEKIFGIKKACRALGIELIPGSYKISVINGYGKESNQVILEILP